MINKSIKGNMLFFGGNPVALFKSKIDVGKISEGIKIHFGITEFEFIQDTYYNVDVPVI